LAGKRDAEFILFEVIVMVIPEDHASRRGNAAVFRNVCNAKEGRNVDLTWQSHQLIHMESYFLQVIVFNKKRSVNGLDFFNFFFRLKFLS